jgi:hypothetical protein
MFTKNELIILQDFLSFLRIEDNFLTIPYNNIYCYLHCESVYFNENNIGVLFELRDNFDNLTLRFAIDSNNNLISDNPKTKINVLTAISEIKKAIKINEYKVNQEIYENLSLNCCNLDEGQVLFKYNKYCVEVESLDGSALISLSFIKEEYPIAFMLIYALDNKIYYVVYNLGEHTNKMNLLVNGTMQNLIMWCTL